ncbi:MAG: hypothetical protein ACK5JT_15690, partial [Hyphomicrobiaceae bacterium]
MDDPNQTRQSPTTAKLGVLLAARTGGDTPTPDMIADALQGLTITTLPDPAAPAWTKIARLLKVSPSHPPAERD